MNMSLTRTPNDRYSELFTHKESDNVIEFLLPPLIVIGAAMIPNKKLSNWHFDKDYLYKGSWLVPIGKKRKVIYHNFEHYPHLLIGGTTRFGKTVFLKSLFASLLYSCPNKAKIVLIDLKGGLEFYKYKTIPQVQTVATDLIEACKALDNVYKTMKQMEKVFLQNGWSNIVDSPIKERMFIIVDEGAELSPKMVTKDLRKYAELAQIYLSEIARIGGGLGFRLVFATQYPTREAVPMQVKMNMVARLAFRMPDQVGSRVILDEVGAEELKPIPGRAIYKVAESIELQCPFIDDKMIGGIINELGSNRKDITND